MSEETEQRPHCDYCAKHGHGPGISIFTADGRLQDLRYLSKLGELADRRQGGRLRSPRSIPGTTVQA